MKRINVKEFHPGGTCFKLPVYNVNKTGTILGEPHDFFSKPHDHYTGNPLLKTCSDGSSDGSCDTDATQTDDDDDEGNKKRSGFVLNKGGRKVGDPPLRESNSDEETPMKDEAAKQCHEAVAEYSSSILVEDEGFVQAALSYDLPTPQQHLTSQTCLHPGLFWNPVPNYNGGQTMAPVAIRHRFITICGMYGMIDKEHFTYWSIYRYPAAHNGSTLNVDHLKNAVPEHRLVMLDMDQKLELVSLLEAEHKVIRNITSMFIRNYAWKKALTLNMRAKDGQPI
jgi:hypothetical protein